MAHHFTACHAGQIPAGCTLSRCLSHLAANVYESYSYVQILTIPAADFIRQTATSGSTSRSVPHDLNVYPRCARWWFTAHRHRKSQSFESSLRAIAWAMATVSHTGVNLGSIGLTPVGLKVNAQTSKNWAQSCLNYVNGEYWLSRKRHILKFSKSPSRPPKTLRPRTPIATWWTKRAILVSWTFRIVHLGIVLRNYLN